MRKLMNLLMLTVIVSSLLSARIALAQDNRGLWFSNNTNSEIRLVVSYQYAAASGGDRVSQSIPHYVTKGWFRIPPGGKIRVEYNWSSHSDIYYYAVSETAEWSGNGGKVLWITNDDFENFGTVSTDIYGLASHHDPGYYPVNPYVTNAGRRSSWTVEFRHASAVTNGWSSCADVNSDLHLVGLTGDGKLWHTIRYADTLRGWQRFGDVETQTGDPGFATDVAVACVNGDLHVVAVTSDGRLSHTIRYADTQKGWQLFDDVKKYTGDPGSVTNLSLANVNGDLHVAAVTSDGNLWHTIRYADTSRSWQTFGFVKGPANDPSFITDVSVSVVNGDLHVAAVTGDGNLWHAIRYADTSRSWQTFNSVKGPAGDPGFITRVAIIGINSDLHINAVTNDGNLWHAIGSYTTNSWIPFGFVKTQTGDKGWFTDVTAASLHSGLHIVGVTTNRALWHTIRYADTQKGWQLFDSVKRRTGEPNTFLPRRLWP